MNSIEGHDVKIFTDNIEVNALEQIKELLPSGKIVREERLGFKPLVGEEMGIYREAKQLVTGLHCYRELKDSGRITHKELSDRWERNKNLSDCKPRAGQRFFFHTASRVGASVSSKRLITHIGRMTLPYS